MSSRQHPTTASNYAGTKGGWARKDKLVTEPMPEGKKRVWLFDSCRAAKRFVRSGNPIAGKLQ